MNSLLHTSQLITDIISNVWHTKMHGQIIKQLTYWSGINNKRYKPYPEFRKIASNPEKKTMLYWWEHNNTSDGLMLLCYDDCELVMCTHVMHILHTFSTHIVHGMGNVALCTYWAFCLLHWFPASVTIRGICEWVDNAVPFIKQVCGQLHMLIYHDSATHRWLNTIQSVRMRQCSLRVIACLIMVWVIGLSLFYLVYNKTSALWGVNLWQLNMWQTGIVILTV